MKKIKSIFVAVMLVFFLMMNVGVLKNNEMTTVLFVIGLSWASLFLLWIFRRHIPKDLCVKSYTIVLICIFFIFLVLQAAVVYNIPLSYFSDFALIKGQAMALSKDFHILPECEQYFNMYPYQINLVVLVNWIYRLVGEDYHRVELFSAAIVNLSAIIAAVTVKHLTGNRFLAIIVAIFSEILSLFCLKTYLPYTNNLGEIFPVLCVCVYVSRMGRTKKIILMTAIASVGAMVKITTIIPFMGICLVEGVRFIKERRYKEILISGSTLVLMFFCLSIARGTMIKKLEFNQDPSWEHGFVYFLAMGQNNQVSGQFYKPIGIIGDQYYSTKAERDELFWNMAKTSIKERSLIGQVKFFLIKISYCWGEVRQDHLNFSRYDKPFLILQHYVWYFALLMMTLGMLLIDDRRYYALTMGIWGIVGYLFLSEAGSRYVMMYTPIVFAMMGWAMHALNEK